MNANTAHESTQITGDIHQVSLGAPLDDRYRSTTATPFTGLRVPTLDRAVPAAPFFDGVVTNTPAALTTEALVAFNQRVVMIGNGVYGQAIRARFGSDVDAVAWQRPHGTGQVFESGVTSDLATAVDKRGLMVLAVSSDAFPDVLERIIPHPKSVVVSLAKGLIVAGWNPLQSEASLMAGPPEGARALTPLEYIREHPNWRQVADNVVFVAGPGFAKDVQSGAHLGLTISSNCKDNPRATEALAKAFWLFSGMKGDRTIEVYDNSTALEISSSMKNVAALAAGIVLGIMKKNGALECDQNGGFRVIKRVAISCGDSQVQLDEQTIQRLSSFASREITNVIKSEGGGNAAQLNMAGNYDLNLTMNSFKSRNVQAGIRLVEGKESLYEILTKRNAEGHRLTAEGVLATHAMACRIQNNKNSEAFAPLVFAVRNILLNRGTPEQIMAQYFSQTKAWTEGDAHRILNGMQKPMGLRMHVEESAGYKN